MFDYSPINTYPCTPPGGATNIKKKSTKQEGHSGDFGNGAKFVWKMSKSVMQLISIRF